MHLKLNHHQWIEDKETKILLKDVKEQVQTLLKPGQNPGGSMDDNVGRKLIFFFFLPQAGPRMTHLEMKLKLGVFQV